MAIVFIDVVGFSALVERDERGTYAQWSLVRGTIVEPGVDAHSGRIVKSTGDGFLIKFQSAVAAAEFAIEVQAKVEAHAAESGSPILLRIAVHMGDVIGDGNDLYGDCVIVAARLQEFADPGGVVISGAVHDQVQRVLTYDTVELGWLQLKNIERPVRALKIGRGHGRAAGSTARATHRPSIAVLPFRLLGPEPELKYAAEGMVHSIVASLAGLRELFVIGSSSTVSLSADAADPAGLSRLLGARYLLTGSIARSGTQLRFGVELTDAETKTVVWSDRYKIDAHEVFDLEDEIATRAAYSLVPLLRQSELQRSLRKHPDKLDAYDLLVQALYRLYRFEADDFAKARELLAQAIERDPDYALPYSFMAKWHILNFGQGYSTDVAANSNEAAHYARLALMKDPGDPLALTLYGHTLSFLFGRCDEALDLFERAIAACPNSAISWGLSAPTYCYVGLGTQAIDRARYALLLSPLDPCSPFYKTTLTLANYFNGDFEEAVLCGRKTLAAAPRFTANMRPLIAALVATDRIDEARRTAATMMSIEPHFRVGSFRERYPVKDPAVLALLCERLSAAGLPE